jgi:hypothetical protein
MLFYVQWGERGDGSGRFAETWCNAEDTSQAEGRCKGPGAGRHLALAWEAGWLTMRKEQGRKRGYGAGE